MVQPVISVVIPTYNSAKFISGTLDSLKNQTFTDFEIVIVNDGSSDNTASVILNYISSYPESNILLFNQNNGGIAFGRNRGISESMGKYIAFLDHDDIWYPDKLKKCYEIFMQYPDVDLVCHDELMRNETGRVMRYLSYGPYVNAMFRRLLYKGNCISTSATVVKKDALYDVGFFRESPEFFSVEDYDLWLRLAKKHKFYFIKEILGEYIMHNKNASLNLERHYNNQIKILKLNFKEDEKKKIFDCLLISFRITHVNLILAKQLISIKNYRIALRYIVKSFLHFFTHV